MANLKEIFKLCREYVRAHRKLLTLYIFLCVFLGLQSLASPYITGNFIDSLISSSSGANIIKYCAVFVAITLSGVIIGYVTNRLYIKLQTTISYELNKSALAHLQRVSYSFVKNQDTAALNQRINNDSNVLITFYISLCQNIVINVITVFIGFAIIASFNMILAEVLFVLIPCYSLAYSIFKQKLFDRGLKLKQSQTDYFSRLNEQISFIKQIKVFGLFDSFSNRLNQVFTRTLSCAYGYQKVSYSFSAIDTLILSIAQVFLFIYGGHQVVAGKLSVGNFTIISSYFALMMTSVRYFFSLGKSVQETRVSYERLNGIMSMPVETVGKIELNKIETICTKSLSLSENNKTIVSDLNVSFETGHIYSICGFNGSGKSTFINLLIGLYVDEYKGDILINNLSLQEIDMYSLRRRSMGIFEQNPVLFEDTISYNIQLNQDELNAENIIQAIDILGLRDFLNNLPQGLDTFLHENASNISGGEKQKIALLRAIIKNPDVLLLDEPTSALDTITTKRLIEYLISIKEEKIIIVVSHNDEVSQIADKTIWLEGGKQVLEGK